MNAVAVYFARSDSTFFFTEWILIAKEIHAHSVLCSFICSHLVEFILTSFPPQRIREILSKMAPPQTSILANTSLTCKHTSEQTFQTYQEYIFSEQLNIRFSGFKCNILEDHVYFPKYLYHSTKNNVKINIRYSTKVWGDPS